MKRSILNPDTLAIVDAFWVTVVYLVAYVTVSLIWFDFRWVPLLISVPIVFIVNYFIIEYTFSVFVYNRIRLIYKAIGRSVEKKGKDYEKENSLKGVEQVVHQWSEEKNREIEELKKMADYRREFLGNVSHELKTPIFNIQGYVTTLLDGALEDKSINRRFLKKTNKSINRLINIVNDLEKISKLEAGEMKLIEKPFILNDLVDEVVDFLEMKAEKAGVEIKTVIQKPEKLEVVADQEAIREVLINLIENAIKYNDKLNGKVEVRLFDMDEKVLVEVADNGIGIPGDLLPRIFERFFRTDQARARKTGGTGLGLAIVKHIIEAHRQHITVQSTPGKETVFSFTLQKAK